MIKISTTPNQKIRSILLGRGLTLTDWAKSNNLKPTTVSQTLWRYAGKGIRPQNGISLNIITRLEKETGINICGAALDTEHFAQ